MKYVISILFGIGLVCFLVMEVLKFVHAIRDSIAKRKQKQVDNDSQSTESTEQTTVTFN